MTNTTIYLAVAGAGKTYTICNHLDINRRNLILSYTNENISNLSKELIKRFGNIPGNVIVMTFDSFILSYFIWPYYKMIQSELFKKEIKEKKIIDVKKYSFDINKKYLKSKTNFNHYFTINADGDYCLKLDEAPSLLVVDDLKFADGRTLYDVGLERVKYFFDVVYIDEFQDYRLDKYEFMKKLMLDINEGYMFGDYYQHSVSGQNNTGKPFKKNTTYKSFIKDLKKVGFNVDIETLNKTRRCSPNICAFVRKKLSIEIYPNDDTKKGSIDFLNDKKDVEKVMKYNPKILTLHKEAWSDITYGLSKGDTFDDVIVVLPSKYIIKNNVNLDNVEGNMKNKIYVALTRAKNNVYLTSKKIIEEFFKDNNH